MAPTTWTILQKHDGVKLVATINKYTIATQYRITQFLEHNILVHYSTMEGVREVDTIEHPSARECLRFLGIDGGIEIHQESDLPSCTGLAASSSATVALLHALHAFNSRPTLE